MIYLGHNEMLDREGINLHFLLEMQQLGVLSGVEGVLNITLSSTEKDKFVRALISHGKVLVAKHDDPTKKLNLNPIRKISAIGRQLFRLGNFKPHDEYLRKLGDAIKSLGFDVELATYVQVNDTTINYFNSEKL